MLVSLLDYTDLDVCLNVVITDSMDVCLNVLITDSLAV